MAKPPWKPLELSSLPEMKIIACDPSLTALGLVLVEIRDAEVAVHAAEKLATVPTERKGWDDTFYRADLMEALIDAYLDNEWPGFADTSCVAAHEAPPVNGSNMMRTESTILTGKAFRTVVNEMNIKLLELVTPPSHKYLICGNGRATKKEHHDALKLLLPRIINSGVVTNEATRDALSIALYAAWRQGQTDGN